MGALPHGASVQRQSRRHAIVIVLATLSAHRTARAQPAAPTEVADAIANARLQGHGRMRFLGLHLYDVRLWVGDDFSPESSAERLLALELEYAHGFTGQAIAERSLAEMRRADTIAPDDGARWLAAMGVLFPDVAKGDRLTGVQHPGSGARFFHNGRLRGELREPRFAQSFFRIWLGPKTSAPKLRLALLGLPT